MKSILLSFLILAILSKVVRPTYDDNAYDNLTIASNDDPNSCLIFLNLTINPKKITFYATVIQNDNSDCTHHDLQFMSSFRGDNITGQVTLVPTEDNANVSTGDLTLDNVTKYNGTACLYSGYQVDNGTIFYGCQFKYNDVIFVLDFGLDPVTGDFATDNWINLFNPYLGVNKVVNQNNISVWRANTSFPQIVGMLYKQCGSWSSIINSLSTELTITGTELQSNTLNLTQFWSNYTFNSMWIRRKELLTSNLTYYAYKPDFDWFAFNNTSGGNCSDTGLTYARILNDLEFCKNGCDFSAFVILNHSIALLQTGGFATQP